MPLTSKVRLAVTASQNKILDLSNASASTVKDYNLALASGVSVGQADTVFTDTRTLAASASEDIDLAGSLLDALSGPAAFVKVKALIVAAAAANTNNVVVGGATATGFIAWVGAATHTVTVRPGAVLALLTGGADVDGYAVAAGASDLLKIANGGAGTSVTYDLIVIGTSA
ncbi:MAG: hypothetical protein L0I76_24455 [Pseudonocardia sp.]|nr:hypothetical protein [Pseudonocardia sp.]